jgi:hypothetical protein
MGLAMSIPAADCPHCKSGPECFSYLKRFEFDVDRARALTTDGRDPVEVDDDSLRETLIGCRIVPGHVGHVDVTFPGIIAHFSHPDPAGEMLHGHVLIDGNHRAARCLRDGHPFFAYLLSEAESRVILTVRSAAA